MTSSPGTTTAKRRVVHVGTGMTGSVALRAIIDDPALDLVGLKVSSPTKVGTDAGQLCGRPDVGIAATDDVAAVWTPSRIASPTARPPSDVKTK